MFDELVRSRHSRLSGIVVLYNVLKRNDSGQAGMTSKEGFSTFYETVMFQPMTRIELPATRAKSPENSDKLFVFWETS
jgi:hypothetical protein